MKLNSNVHAAPSNVSANIHTELNAYEQLRRTVLACLLWEDQFYENGEAIAERIGRLVLEVPSLVVSSLAIEARHSYHLRHAPLLLCALMSIHFKGSIVSNTIASVIRRPDEACELLAIIAKLKGRPTNLLKGLLTKQVKTGISRAFNEFTHYQLAKYKREKAGISLKDVMLLCHPKPNSSFQASIWMDFLDGKLLPADTWETALSSGEPHKQVWERLMRDKDLGASAFLKNLRNMREHDVDSYLIEEYFKDTDFRRNLPYEFAAAYRAAPWANHMLFTAMLSCVQQRNRFLLGRTIILVDNSYSMGKALSSKSSLTRRDAALALALVAYSMCQYPKVIVFSTDIAEATLDPNLGFENMERISGATNQLNTYLGAAISKLEGLNYQRMIVITDEETQGEEATPTGYRNYMLNISSNEKTVAYGSAWAARMTGFSSNLLEYIVEVERHMPALTD